MYKSITVQTEGELIIELMHVKNTLYYQFMHCEMREKREKLQDLHQEISDLIDYLKG